MDGPRSAVYVWWSHAVLELGHVAGSNGRLGDPSVHSVAGLDGESALSGSCVLQWASISLLECVVVPSVWLEATRVVVRQRSNSGGHCSHALFDHALHRPSTVGNDMCSRVRAVVRMLSIHDP